MPLYANLANQLSVKQSIAAATYSTANAATLDGTGVDIGELVGNISVVIDAALASSGESMTFKMQHSYDNSSWADVASDALVDPSTGDAATFSTNDATHAIFQTLAVKRDRVRRYIRIQGTAAGDGTPTYKIAGYILGIKKYE